MKMHQLFVLCILLTLSSQAQRDSTTKIKLSGLQIDIRPGFFPQFAPQYQADFQKFVPNDELLNQQLPKYSDVGNGARNYFNAIAGITAFAKIPTKKNVNVEVFAGLKYGHEHSGGAYYAGQYSDTIDAYSNSQNEIAFYKLYSETYNYHFNFQSFKLIVPLGVQITSNQNNYLWFSLGLEIAPALNFAYKFQSFYYNSAADIIVESGADPSPSYGSIWSYSNSELILNETSLPGVGFSTYLAIPMSVYIHPFKKVSPLNRFHVVLAVIPGYMYTNTKYSGSASDMNVSASAGLRFNFKN